MRINALRTVTFFLLALSGAVKADAGVVQYNLYLGDELKATQSLTFQREAQCAVHAIFDPGLLLPTVSFRSVSECSTSAEWRLQRYEEESRILGVTIPITRLHFNEGNLTYSRGKHSEDGSMSYNSNRARVDSLSVIFAIRDKLLANKKSGDFLLVIPDYDGGPPELHPITFVSGCTTPPPKPMGQEWACAEVIGANSHSTYWYRPSEAMTFYGRVKGDSLIWRSNH